MIEDRPGGAHYGGKDNPFEPIKIIKAMDWGLGFNRGNALKYLLRAGTKNGKDGEIMDLKKAIQYVRFELERLEAIESMTLPTVRQTEYQTTFQHGGEETEVNDDDDDSLGLDILASVALNTEEVLPVVIPDIAFTKSKTRPLNMMGDKGVIRASNPDLLDAWEILKRPTIGVKGEETGIPLMDRKTDKS